MTLAKKDDKPAPEVQGHTQDIERLKNQLDMLDQRLDNIDSIVTAVAERIMKQPITLTVTCAHCGKDIEIAILGTQKPTR